MKLLRIVEGIFLKITKSIRERSVWLRSVEVACDIKLSDADYSKSLHQYLSRYATLKFARAGNRKRFIGTDGSSTDYTGKDGNVRKGPKAVRGYVKEEENRQEDSTFNINVIKGRFIRIELVVNSPTINKKRLALGSWCEYVRNIDIWESIIFREDMVISRLAKCIIGNEPGRNKANSTEEQIVEYKELIDELGQAFYSEIDGLSVSHQIDYFKKKMLQEHFFSNMDDIFPKMENPILKHIKQHPDHYEDLRIKRIIS
ncbi:MAG: hypothetical protein HQK96_10755 [Nitrospirae bacterium]|nr:hypothetical protein [Nitrospirota bacterium]